jgi:tetratricopeptide (TPR) repeat protein
VLFRSPGASRWIDQALVLARKYGDQHIEALALGIQGQVDASLGEFARSQKAIQNARQVASRVGSPLTESDVDLLAAWAYLAMGDTQHGLEFGQRSVEKATATDNMDCICNGLACIGYGNLELQRIPEAIAAFKKGIERSEVSGAIIPKQNGQAGLAMAQFYSGQVQAIEDMEAVLAPMRAYENHVGEANANLMLGSCLIQLGTLDRAETFLKRAVDYYRRSEMRPFLAKALLSLSVLLEKQGRLPEAQECCAEAEALKQALTR